MRETSEPPPGVDDPTGPGLTVEEAGAAYDTPAMRKHLGYPPSGDPNDDPGPNDGGDGGDPNEGGDPNNPEGDEEDERGPDGDKMPRFEDLPNYTMWGQVLKRFG